MPFLKVLAGHPELASEIARLSARPVDQRVDVENTYRSIEHWVETTGDADLGLRAGEATCLGNGGAQDFAFHTAETLQDGILIAERFSHLYNEALEITLVTETDRASIQFGDALGRPRAVTDFVLSAWYLTHLRPHVDSSVELRCQFSYRRPESTALHELMFRGVELSFGATHDAFSFDVRALHRALGSANRALHALHRQHLEVLQSSLASTQAIAPRVRGLIAAELQHGYPSSSMVARKLRVSRRTLVRRLHDENTTFRLQLDAVRRSLALRLISMRTLSLAEISGLLGFSHVQAFHRAFRRWTGQTPQRYRESLGSLGPQHAPTVVA